MLDAGSQHAGAGQRACSVRPLPSRRRLVDTSPAEASLDNVHGPPDCLSSAPVVSHSASPSRPRSAPPLLPTQDMTTRPDRPVTPPCGSTPDDLCHADVHPGTANDVELAQRHARGTQVSPRELPKDPQLQDHSDGDRESHTAAGLPEQFRTSKKHARACAASRLRLRQLNIALARTSRLVHAARSVQRTLADCLRTEDKPCFLSLFDAFHEALAHASTPFETEADTDLDPDGHEYPLSFVDSLPGDSKAAVLSLVAKVKCDVDYLAERLCTLGQSELTALLPQKSMSNDSVLAVSQRPSSTLSRQPEALERQKDRLHSYEYGSPLETLVLAARTSSGGALQDDLNATNIWARVSARLIAKQSPGSDMVVPALVDVWKSCSRWPGRDRLELWILQTLHAGAFLLEKPNSQTFQMRTQAMREDRLEDDVRRETFYSQSADSLLDLLGEDAASTTVIPDGAICLCAAIHEELSFSPGHRSAFPSFIATRWLVASFLPSAVTFPEMYGMAADRYVSEQARTKILREVVNRARRIILDVVYASKFGNRLAPQMVSRVAKILKHFQDRSTPSQTESSTPKAKAHSRSAAARSAEFVMLSSHDVTTLVDALYPIRRPTSICSDYDMTSSILTSSASSVSGFSLFRNAAPSDFSPIATSPVSVDPSGSPMPWLNGTDVPGLAHSSGGVSPPVETGSEEALLRSAYADIKSFVQSADEPELAQWAVLIASKASCVRSLREELVQHDGDMALPDGACVLSPEYKTCRAALEALLDDDEDEELSLSSSVIPPKRVDEMNRDAFVDQVRQAFEARRSQAELQSDFLTAYSWFQHWQSFQLWVDSGVSASEVFGLVEDLAMQALASTKRSKKTTELCERWLSSLGSFFGHSLSELGDFEVASRQLRNKMWYVGDIRISSAYDEARSVSSALHVMGKPKLSSSSRSAPPLRHSVGSKWTQMPFHMKTEAQILDILSAAPRHGGPNKLSDDQTRALSAWMEQNRVENLCRGEERLHKLCMEVKKCIDRMFVGGPSNDAVPLWSWSNPLFTLDARIHASQSESATVDPYSMLRSNFEHIGGLRKMRSDISVSSLSISSRPLSSRSSKDFLDARSPTWTNRSSAPFWSPAMTEAQTFSSATSIIGSVRAKRTPRRIGSSRKALNATRNLEDDFLQQLRQHITSLLLSDLTTTIFNYGSETDCAFWTGLGGELADKHMDSILLPKSVEIHETSARRQFEFTEAYRRLMSQFSYSPCPFAKLGFLHDIDALIERQYGQLRKQQLAETGFQSDVPRAVSPPTVGFSSMNDVRIDGFRKLFCDPATRPATILRDLQFIAALVPCHTLENTPQGRSFWNAAVAISGLKQEVRNIMVETADSIIAYQSNHRGQQHQSTASAAQQERDSATFAPPTRTPSAEDIARYTMADAAYLLQITAKEGDAVGQRELATLYLTHPELMGHTIAPFTRPREVFKEELENRWRKNQDPTRCDPATMCVAHHWMSLSSKGGDALAKEYLRQREEMDKLP